MKTDRRPLALGLWMAAACLCLAVPAPSRAGGRLAAGEAAPPFALPDLAGRPISLASFEGRAVLLHFWATWCPVCREEMPLLEEAARSRPERLAVLGINLGEKHDKVAAYARDAGLTFPILLDARWKVAARYGVVSLPITILVGPDGRVAGRIPMGSLTREALEERLEALLGP